MVGIAADGKGRCGAGRWPAAGAAPVLAGAGAAAAGAAELFKAGAGAAAAGAGAPTGLGAPVGPPGGNVGSLMVGAAVGFGGKLMRTVSFLG